MQCLITSVHIHAFQDISAEFYGRFKTANRAETFSQCVRHFSFCMDTLDFKNNSPPARLQDRMEIQTIEASFKKTYVKYHYPKYVAYIEIVLHCDFFFGRIARVTVFFWGSNIDKRTMQMVRIKN